MLFSSSANFLVPEGQMGTVLTFDQILVNSQLYMVDLIQPDRGSDLGSGGSALPGSKDVPSLQIDLPPGSGFGLHPLQTQRCGTSFIPEAKQRRYSGDLNVSERLSGIQNENTRAIKESAETNVNGMKQ